jgi:putative nucleotidyltransferase with HDIG domain
MFFFFKLGRFEEMDLLDLFEEETRIPSPPEVFYRFKEAVDDPDTSFEELGEIISSDLGLTARLLKIVNSPFYGFSNQVETISHAISIIGSSQLNDLVLSTCIIDRFKNTAQKALDMQLFWEHSIACGLTSKIIANHLSLVNPNSIFVAGLLHDIGRLVICLNTPAAFSEIFLRAQNSQVPVEGRSEAKSLLQAENEILGFGHDQVGEELLKRWKLPKIHQEAVGHHHKPVDTPLFEKEATIVCVSNAIVQSLDIGCSGELSAPQTDNASLAMLGIKDEQIFSNIKEEVQEKCQHTIEAFL